MGNTNLKASDLDPDNFQGKVSQFPPVSNYNCEVHYRLIHQNESNLAQKAFCYIWASFSETSKGFPRYFSIILIVKFQFVQLSPSRTLYTITVSARAASERSGVLSARRPNSSLP